MKNIKEYISQLNEIEEYNIPEQEFMTEMANIRKHHTNLPVVIWVESGVTRDTRHNTPRLKFQNSTSDKISDSELIPISISKDPKILIKNFSIDDLKISKKEFDEIRNWIIKYYEDLMKYWNKEIDIIDFTSVIKK